MFSGIKYALALSGFILFGLLMVVLGMRSLKRSAKERADFTACASQQILIIVSGKSGLSITLKNIKTGWGHERCFPWEHPSTRILLRKKLYTEVRFKVLDGPLEGQDPYSPEAYLEIID